jgi:uncharacterized protein
MDRGVDCAQEASLRKRIGRQMRYKIKDIGDEGVEIRVPVTAAWLQTECPDLEARPGESGLELTGRLERSGEDFLLRGDLRGDLLTTCGRCLEPATVHVDQPVAVSFVEEDEAKDDEDEEDAGDVLSFSGGEIDLGPELRDEILLAMPIGPLCRPECGGICSVCGGNRNLTPCDCEEQQRIRNSKLSALKNIKV